MLWIGSSDGSLTELIRQRLTGIGRLMKQQGNYLRFDFPADQLHLLSAELSSLILEELFPRILISALKDSAKDLSPTDLRIILSRTISHMRDNGTLAELCESTAAQISEIMKHSDLLTVEGVFYFRCRNYLPVCEAYLSPALAEFRASRLLSILKIHVRRQPPYTDYLRIAEEDQRYCIRDREGREIIPAFPASFTPEEALINTLLVLSPGELDLSALYDPALRAILEEVFSDRIPAKQK